MPKIDTELVEAYSKISKRYSELKRKPWKDFQIYKSMISKNHQLPNSGILLDIGTGNGRNLILFEEEKYEFLATDLSYDLLSNFVKISQNRIHRINNDMKLLPLKDESVDLALCIATLHHSRSNKEASIIIRNIEKVMKTEGVLILSCWRRWKKNTIALMLKDFLLYPIKKIQYKNWRHGDIYLPWFNDCKEIIAERYYHLFTKKELLKIFRRSCFEVLDLCKLGGKNGKDNFFFLLRKSES